MDDTPFNIERQLGTPTAERRDWSALASILVKVPFMKRSVVQLGTEYLRFPRHGRGRERSNPG